MYWRLCFTFSSFASMYPLRSVSYLRQACRRRVMNVLKYTPDFTFGWPSLYITWFTVDCTKETMVPGCHLTMHKYRICQSPYQRWIPKPLQHSLPFPCRKLCSIYNVWLSENSFNTRSSLNITPPLKTVLNPQPELWSRCSVTHCFPSNCFSK